MTMQVSARTAVSPERTVLECEWRSNIVHNIALNGGGVNDARYWFNTKNSDGTPIFTAPAKYTFSTQNVRNLIYGLASITGTSVCLSRLRSLNTAASSSVLKHSTL